MGNAQSAGGHCIPHLKKTFLDKARHRSLPSTDATEDSVTCRRLLNREDFKESNISVLAKQFPGLTHVRIQPNSKWIPTDDEIKKLVVFLSLTSVDLSGCEISRKGVMGISYDLSKIKCLILNDCRRLSDTFLETIIRFENLERLEIGGCFNVSDRGIEFLSSLKNLKCLNLSMKATLKSTLCTDSCCAQNISDVSLRTLGKITGLRTLNISRCEGIPDSGFIHLITLNNLVNLDLSWTGLTDTGLKILQFLTELRTLDVSGCVLAGSVASKKLNFATNLTQLNLSSIPTINDTFLSEITSLQKLQSLNISGCKMLTDAGLKHLSQFKSLASLKANSCSEISGKGVSYLSGLPTIQELRMNEAMDTNYEDVLRLSKLQHLEMGIRTLEEKQLTKLTALKNLSDLTLCLPNTTTDISDMCVYFGEIRVHILLNKKLLLD